MRSIDRRFGARWRARFSTSSCCLRSTDSATIERAPLGVMSLAMVATR
jgi:hypothetical protein